MTWEAEMLYHKFLYGNLPQLLLRLINGTGLHQSRLLLLDTSEISLHKIKPMRVKKQGKRNFQLPLQHAEQQGLIRPCKKKCLIGLQKGVSCTSINALLKDK